MKFLSFLKRIRIPMKDRHQIRLLYTLLAYLIFNFIMGPLIEKYVPTVGGHFTENVSHIILTVGAVFMGTLIDHTFLFEELKIILDNKMNDNSIDIYEKIRSELIPMIREFGISEVHQKVEFSQIFSQLMENDRIDVFLTYHPHLNDFSHLLVEKILKSGVKCRLLLGNPDSEELKNRFSCIDSTRIGYNWSDLEMLENLRLFLTVKIPKIIERNRSFRSGNKFVVKTFSALPDMPLVIISEGANSGQTIVKRVLQGYYLRRPAVELPFVEWVPVKIGDPKIDSMAQLLLAYFEYRWDHGTELPIS